MTPILYVGDVKQNDYEQYIQERVVYGKVVSKNSSIYSISQNNCNVQTLVVEKVLVYVFLVKLFYFRFC